MAKLFTDLKALDAHVIKPAEYEDAPELTDEQLRNAVLAKPSPNDIGQASQAGSMRTGRIPSHETLWVTDAELIRRAGVPYKIAHAAIQVLDQTKGSGFPPKQRLWGNRRYWPAVKNYFDRIGGLK